jgi:hypothetical protein
MNLKITIMKKLFLISLLAAAALIFGCVKHNVLPTFTPAFAKNFSVSSLNHTADTVNVGDTIYLNAAGTMSDTVTGQNNIYAYFVISSSAPGAPTYSYGSASAPIKLTKTFSAASNGLYGWTSTIAIVGATTTANSKLTVTGNFIYQLSLSSEGNGTASATDAGVLNKAIFVQ